MNDKRYRYTLYLIVIVIITTIGIQVYWNYKNYLNSKQQLINDVQVSLDKAVDDYYANLAKRATIGFAFLDSLPVEIDHIFTELDFTSRLEIDTTLKFNGGGTFQLEIDSHSDSLRHPSDSIIKALRFGAFETSEDSLKTSIQHYKINTDSLRVSNFKMLTSKVIASANDDALDIELVDTLLKSELNRKKIDIQYHISYDDPFVRFNNKTLDNKAIENIDKDKLPLNTVSKSSFLPEGSKLTLNFSNETMLILKRILSGIIISTLLVLTVISLLFYLLKVIRQQKQLAEVKNDLISNITHEFKTPIATIGVALESIKDFNTIEDKEKTKSYLDMSNQQLDKLNIMVEKLLETATLDSENLELNIEKINISELLSNLVSKYKIQDIEKEIHIETPSEVYANVDAFHFENAINNVLDNAIKYGGDIIKVSLEQWPHMFTVNISDNGEGLSKANKDRIFEKFYRVPKGNTHDIKGFGIGLYYTKTIIEKHNGAINLDLNNNLTTFKITLPNA
ncbi:ATP-binding protein [Winogradskyella sp. 3972H.M.0a.05]|uniref:sensor histidine kinase n=1 Tax=Winogradskyella sp. 3972H.M.0a.05 TaxID=2950277 RepID=UPI00339743D4